MRTWDEAMATSTTAARWLTVLEIKLAVQEQAGVHGCKNGAKVRRGRCT
jgi:hypothetical protein